MLRYLRNNQITAFCLILSLFCFFGALIYRIYSLNFAGSLLSFLLSLSVFIILVFWIKNKEFSILKKNKTKEEKMPLSLLILIILFFACLAANIFLLINGRTAEAIISPWQAVDKIFFFFYFLESLLILIIICLNNLSYRRFLNIAILSCHFLVSFGVAVLIYKIGYGFDPFIHEATLKLINQNGLVEPKPFYYLGYYGLLIIAQKFFFLPISILNKIIVPLLAAIILPALLMKYFTKNYENEKIGYLIAASSLIFPFSIFIISTPQNLAYLMLIILIFHGLNCQNHIELIISYLLALGCLAIHPMAGLPAVFFVIFLTVYHLDNNEIKKYLYSAAFVLSGLALPVALFFSGGDFNFSEAGQAWRSFEDLFQIFNSKRESFWLNAVYFYGFNLKYAVLAFILTGLTIVWRYRREAKILITSLLMAVSLLVSHLIIKRFDFPDIIEYESQNFSNRILIEAAIFCLPFIFLVLYKFFEKLLKQGNGLKIIFLFSLSLLMTASCYLSYPRFDNYFNSRGYSTGKYDLEAARRIEASASGDYIVLANQQVSAGALKEFGFKKYYYSDIFYYPIPTSGPLYQYYLKMVYDSPSRKNMEEAMALAGVAEAYFVLNKYWWAFPKILAEAKLEADSWEAINDEVYIFKYFKKDITNL